MGGVECQGAPSGARPPLQRDKGTVWPLPPTPDLGGTWPHAEASFLWGWGRRVISDSGGKW